MKIRNPFPAVARSVFASIAAGHVLFFMIMLPFIVILTFHVPRINMLMMYRTLVYRERFEPILAAPLDSLPQAFPRMFVVLEDHNFYGHHGIDLKAISEAMERNRKAGPRTYGASTITQQLARTLFLTPNKTYTRKYLEALLALEMDAILSKKRIMELYLNEIEWGKGTFGIRQAAKSQFKAEPGKLTLDQYERLAAIIINPRDYSAKTLEKHPAMRARYMVLQNIYAEKQPVAAAPDGNSSSP